MPVFIDTPLDGVGVMTNPFGIEYGHGGRDLAAFEGAPVYAVVDGPLILHPVGSWGDGSYGNVVKQATGDGWFTLSAHLQQFASDVYDGQVVQAGKRVGYQGHTGFTRPAGLGGSHVHWGLCDVPWFPAFNASTAGHFADPFMYLISEGDRMALFQKLEEIEHFIGGMGGADRVAMWNSAGNLPLLDCLGPQPGELVKFPGVMQQTYGLNELLTIWRPLLMGATPGLVLP